MGSQKRQGRTRIVTIDMAVVVVADQSAFAADGENRWSRASDLFCFPTIIDVHDVGGGDDFYDANDPHDVETLGNDDERIAYRSRPPNGLCPVDSRPAISALIRTTCNDIFLRYSPSRMFQ